MPPRPWRAVARHHKHYSLAELGFHGTAWFRTGRPGFDAVEAAGIEAGFLLRTELFFNEWARHYRRQGARLIAFDLDPDRSAFQQAEYPCYVVEAAINPVV